MKAMSEAISILRVALQRAESSAANAIAHQPESEEDCAPYLARALEQLANLTIKARADARAVAEAQGLKGWWPND